MRHLAVCGLLALLAAPGHRLVIPGSSPAQGNGLWATDGTEAGTGPFLDRGGMEILEPARFAILGDRLLFKTRAFGVPLWESDGTSAGTFLLLPQTVPGTNAPDALIRAGNRVFFPNFDRRSGVELWAVEP